MADIKVNQRPIWIGLAISAVCLVLVLRGVDWVRLVSGLEAAKYEWVLLAFMGVIPSYGIRALRWWMILGRTVELRRCFSALTVGDLLSNVLPFRIGDLCRAGLIPAPFTQGLSSVVVERMLDMLTVIVATGFLAVSMPLPDITRQVGCVMAIVTVVAFVVLVSISTRDEMIERLLNRLPGFLFRVGSTIWFRWGRDFLHGLVVLRNLGMMVKLLGLSALVWAVSGLQTYMVLHAFWPEVTPVAALAVLCTVALGITVPSAPGGLGVYHASVVLALQAFPNISHEAAVSSAFVSHGIYFIGPSGLGLLALWQNGNRLQDILAKAQGFADS